MGGTIVRPVSELNARMTLGRMAIELARHVPGEMAWWLPSDKVFGAWSKRRVLERLTARRRSNGCQIGVTPGGIEEPCDDRIRAEIFMPPSGSVIVCNFYKRQGRRRGSILVIILGWFFAGMCLGGALSLRSFGHSFAPVGGLPQLRD
ncbi:MAG: hypothetical protein R3E66_11435 [bacterium]